MASNFFSSLRLRTWVIVAAVLIAAGLLGMLVGVLSIEYEMRQRALSGAAQAAGSRAALPMVWESLADAWRRYSSNWISAGFRIALIAVGLLTVLYGYRNERQSKPAIAD